jgi:hypothetical protein
MMAMRTIVVWPAPKSSSRKVGKESCVPWLMKPNAVMSSTRETKRRRTFGR